LYLFLSVSFSSFLYPGKQKLDFFYFLFLFLFFLILNVKSK
jgi:hypothetical protein